MLRTHIQTGQDVTVKGPQIAYRRERERQRNAKKRKKERKKESNCYIVSTISCIFDSYKCSAIVNIIICMHGIDVGLVSSVLL